MKHWGLFLLVGLALSGASPALGQDTIRGYFDGPPSGLNVATGALPLQGWAVAGTGVRQVIIQVDGHDIGSALLGRRRPGAERANPGFPDSSAPGFVYRLNTTDFLNGPHEVTARVITQNGSVQVLSPSYRLVFNNNTVLLTPFGRITTPHRNAEIFGTCDPTDPRRRIEPVDGWALDLGVEINDAGIGFVELMIDNQIRSNTRTGCFFDFGTGGLSNCYGLPRPEIESLFPFAKDAPNAGFRFVLDIGALIGSQGFVEGQHLLTIRAGDTSNQVADVDEIPVVFRCIEDINEGAFGRIESPRPGVQYSGRMRVQGHAVDWEGVDRVRVRIDGTFVGLADHGIDDGIFETRPAVFSRYLNFPDAEAPVFRMVPDFDTTTLSDGFHQLEVIVIDKEGGRTQIGEVTFFVDNRDDG